MDGNSHRAFTISMPIPSKILDGGYIPQIGHSEDDQKPTGIVWTESADSKPAVTTIGRSNGREIVEITFPASPGTNAQPAAPFKTKILAWRIEPAVTSPLLPFFVIGGDQIRWYEQILTSDAKNPFLLEVSITNSGNGLMWSNFSFAFGERGAWIEEMHSGGRQQKTRFTKFRPDGSIASEEETDEN